MAKAIVQWLGNFCQPRPICPILAGRVKSLAMNLLQHLRQTRVLGRLALLWFIMSLGAAMASPLVNSQSTELICSGSGVMKLLVKNADGSSTEVASRMLDCPLCATVSAPPPAVTVSVEPAQPLAHVLQPIPAAHTAARAAAPLPARGPPAFS